MGYCIIFLAPNVCMDCHLSKFRKPLTLNSCQFRFRAGLEVSLCFLSHHNVSTHCHVSLHNVLSICKQKLFYWLCVNCYFLDPCSWFILLKCWSPEPDCRPTFSMLVKNLQEIHSMLEGEHYVNLQVTYVNLEQGRPYPSIAWASPSLPEGHSTETLDRLENSGET